MGSFLIIISILVFILGLGIFSQAKSALHEIEAGILFVISAILFTGGCIVNEIADLRKDHKKRADEN